MSDEKTSILDYISFSAIWISIKRNILSFGLYLFIVQALLNLVASFYLPLHKWLYIIDGDSMTAFTPALIIAVVLTFVVLKARGRVSSL